MIVLFITTQLTVKAFAGGLKTAMVNVKPACPPVPGCAVTVETDTCLFSVPSYTKVANAISVLAVADPLYGNHTFMVPCEVSPLATPVATVMIFVTVLPVHFVGTPFLK